MKQIQVSNIIIELEKKRIKNMYLRILPPDGRVHVTAPIRMSEEEIIHFINGKLSWIILQQSKVSHRHTHQDLQYVEGERIYIWGHAYTLVLRDSMKRNQIEVIGDEIIFHIKQECTKDQRLKLMNAWYKKALQEELPFLLARWEKTIGVASDGFRIRDMKTRWGTCNIVTRKICFNLQLAKKPPDCLKYVVVHELVHLLEKSHNSVFKRYMDHFLPEWRSIKRELNGIE